MFPYVLLASVLWRFRWGYNLFKISAFYCQGIVSCWSFASQVIFIKFWIEIMTILLEIIYEKLVKSCQICRLDKTFLPQNLRLIFQFWTTFSQHFLNEIYFFWSVCWGDFGNLRNCQQGHSLLEPRRFHRCPNTNVYSFVHPLTRPWH